MQTVAPQLQAQQNKICAICSQWATLAAVGAALTSILVGAAATARQALVVSDTTTQLAAAIGTVAALVVSFFFPFGDAVVAHSARRPSFVGEAGDGTSCGEGSSERTTTMPESSTSANDGPTQTQSERTIRRRPRANMLRRHTCDSKELSRSKPKLRKFQGVKRDRLVELPLPEAWNRPAACYESDMEGRSSNPHTPLPSPGLPPPRRNAKGAQKGAGGARAWSASSRGSSSDSTRFPFASTLLNLRFHVKPGVPLSPEFLILEQPKTDGTLLVADMASEGSLASEDDFGSILCVGDCIAQVNGEGGAAATLLSRLGAIVSKGGKLHLGVRLRPARFQVDLLRAEGDTAKLGIAIGIDKRDPSKMQVRAVRPEGLAQQWNEAHPERRICTGDWITEVNGQHSDAVAMYAQMQNLVDGSPLCFTIVTPPRKAKWIFAGGNSVPPSPHDVLLPSPPPTPVAVVAQKLQLFPSVPPLPFQ